MNACTLRSLNSARYIRISIFRKSCNARRQGKKSDTENYAIGTTIYNRTRPNPPSQRSRKPSALTPERDVSQELEHASERRAGSQALAALPDRGWKGTPPMTFGSPDGGCSAPTPSSKQTKAGPVLELSWRGLERLKTRRLVRKGAEGEDERIPHESRPARFVLDLLARGCRVPVSGMSGSSSPCPTSWCVQSAKKNSQK